MDQPVSSFVVRVQQRDGYSFETTFDGISHAPLVTDEPPPLGKDEAPNPVRILAAAVGSCLSASLTFCMGRHEKAPISDLQAEVEVQIVRNEQRHLRVGSIQVTLQPAADIDPDALERCKTSFEAFCTVTESVRQGIPVTVTVDPRQT